MHSLLETGPTIQETINIQHQENGQCVFKLGSGKGLLLLSPF